MRVWGWDQPLIEGNVGRRLVEFTYSELLSETFTMYSVYARCGLFENPTPRNKGRRAVGALCAVGYDDPPPPGSNAFEDLRAKPSIVPQNNSFVPFSTVSSKYACCQLENK